MGHGRTRTISNNHINLLQRDAWCYCSIDVASGDSFANVKRWLHEINQNCDEVSRILVGNKCDDPDRRVVLKEDATRFANQMGIQLFETSAKENINVEEMFRAITNLVLSTKKAQRE